MEKLTEHLLRGLLLPISITLGASLLAIFAPIPLFYKILLFLLLSFLSVVIGYNSYWLNDFKNAFRVTKRVSKIDPKDFGIYPYSKQYLPRESDEIIVNTLKVKDVVFITGIPKLGKTRAAFEAIIKFKDWYLIRAKEGDKDIGFNFDKINYPILFRKRKIILFIDDIDKFADRNLDGLIDTLKKRCGKLKIVATGRSGEEFERIEGQRDMAEFLSQCKTSEIEPRRISDDEMRWLAERINKNPDTVEFDGTPGSIVLDLTQMRERYRHLSDVPKAIIRALKLLREGNIYNWPEDFVRNILKSKIFRLDISSSEWNTALNNLKNQGLAFTAKGIVNISHDSYLGDTFIDDFPIENNLLIELCDTLLDLKDAENLFYLANGFYFRKETELGIDCLKFSIRIKPDFAEAHYNLGYMLDDLQRYPDAESAYREAIRINPDYAEAHNNLGNLLKNLQRYPEAESAYREAIRIKPDYAEAHNNLGILLYDLQRYPEAESAYSEAIRINPEHAEAHCNLGVLLDDLQRYPEAESAYSEAIRINPDHAEAHNNLGILLKNLQRYPEAESAYREAIRINPDSAEAHNNLGILLKNLQRYPEAESAYREAIRINPDYAEAHNNLGILLKNLQRYPEAESAYREAIRINPDYAEAHNNQGVLLDDLQRYPDAESAYREAIRINPDDAEVHNNLGILLKNLQRYPEAESAYREAIRIIPDYADAHYNLGVLLYNLQRYPKAESAYREAIRINPEYANVHNNLGVLLHKLQRYPEAESAYREAIRINPDDAEAHNNLGVLLDNLQRYPEAESAYREAIRINPDDAEAHANLGILYKTWDKKAEAIASLKKARALFEKQGRTDDVEYMNSLLAELE